MNVVGTTKITEFQMFRSNYANVNMNKRLVHFVHT